MRATPNRRGQPQRERPAGHLDLPCRVTGRSSSEQEAAMSAISRRLLPAGGMRVEQVLVQGCELSASWLREK
jgi:hypothetical protein